MVLSCWVNCVGSGLYVDAHGPQSDEQEVREEGYDRPEHMENEHCELGKVNEHAQDADNEVVLGVAGEIRISRIQSRNLLTNLQ